MQASNMETDDTVDDPVERVRALQERLRQLQAIEFPLSPVLPDTPPDIDVNPATPELDAHLPFFSTSLRTSFDHPAPIVRAAATAAAATPREKAAEERTRERVAGLQRTQEILRNQSEVVNEMLLGIDFSPTHATEDYDESPLRRLDALRGTLASTNSFPEPGFNGRYPSPNLRRMHIPKPPTVDPPGTNTRFAIGAGGRDEYDEDSDDNDDNDDIGVDVASDRARTARASAAIVQESLPSQVEVMKFCADRRKERVIEELGWRQEKFSLARWSRWMKQRKAAKELLQTGKVQYIRRRLQISMSVLSHRFEKYRRGKNAVQHLRHLKARRALQIWQQSINIRGGAVTRAQALRACDNKQCSRHFLRWVEFRITRVKGREAIKCAEQFAKAQAFLRFQRCVSKAVRAVRSANIAKLHSQQVCCRNAFHHWLEYLQGAYHSRSAAVSAIRRWRGRILHSRVQHKGLGDAEEHFNRRQLKISLEELHSHAEWSQAVRRAGRWLVHSATMSMFGRWRTYVQYRQNKKVAYGEAEAFWRTKSERQVFRNLERGLEVRRIIAVAQRWWSGNTVGRCFNTWCEYIDECISEREACSKADAFNRRRLMQACWSSWRDFQVACVEDGDNNAAALLHWTSRTLAHSFQKLKLHRQYADALAYHSSRLLRSSYTALEGYMHTRRRHHEAIARGDEHWRRSKSASYLQFLTSFIEYQRIIRRGLMFFTHGLHMRIIQCWRDFVEDQKCQRKAVEWFLRLICRRIIYRWTIFVDIQREKKDMKAFGASFYEEGMLRKYISDWRARCESKMQQRGKRSVNAEEYYETSLLRTSLQLFHSWAQQRKENEAILHRFATWFTDLTRRRVFAGWLMHVAARREKKELKRLGNRHYLIKVVRTWSTVTAHQKENMEIIRRAATWLVNALSKRIFIAWISFIESCREIRAEIEENILAMYLKRLKKRARSSKESRAKSCRLEVWHADYSSRKVLARWQARWRTLKFHREQNQSAMDRAFIHWSRRNEVIAMQNAISVVEVARRKRSADDWYYATLLRRCVRTWISFCAESKQFADTANFVTNWYSERLVARMMRVWWNYVAWRQQKAEALLAASEWRYNRLLGASIGQWRALLDARHKLYASEDYWIEKSLSQTVQKWATWAGEKRRRDKFIDRGVLSLKLAVLTWERSQVSIWVSQRQHEMAERHASLSKKRMVIRAWRRCV